MAALLPGILIRPGNTLSLRWPILLVPVTAVGLTAHILANQDDRIEEFPSTIATPIKAYFGLKASTVYLGPREPIAYVGSLSPKIDKVVFIVDESVRGDYLQLNDPRFDNTPFLASHADEMANFGVAVSNTNCSAQARMALRSGVRDTDYPDPTQHVLHQPTFWQYAKAAGYTTVYLDAWLPLRKMHSFLTYDELKFVDERTDVELSPYWNADNQVATRLNELLSRPGKYFIFVEKIGLHAPYGTAIAGLNSSYEPAPSSVLHPEFPDLWKASILDYLKGVHLRVDEFFARSWSSLRRPDVLAIYTSDHGQQMREGGYPASHCSGVNAVKGEGLVPLFLTTGNEILLSAFRASAEKARGRTNHNDIFPTLIWAMGFDPSRVLPAYSPGLVDVPLSRVRRFYVGHPFRKTPDWITVDGGALTANVR